MHIRLLTAQYQNSFTKCMLNLACSTVSPICQFVHNNYKNLHTSKLLFYGINWNIAAMRQMKAIWLYDMLYVFWYIIGHCIVGVISLFFSKIRIMLIRYSLKFWLAVNNTKADWLISNNNLNTELYYSWNRNTAVLLYNQLSDHGERKLLAHVINPYYNSLWRYFK